MTLWEPMCRERIENTKQPHLLNIKPIRIDEQIAHDIALYLEKPIEQEEALAELVAYLEFGLPYERYQVLFNQFLKQINITREELEALVDKKYRTMSLSRKSISEKMFWNADARNKREAIKSKHKIIKQIFELCRSGENGVYKFADAVSDYELIIQKPELRLVNITKGIEYMIGERYGAIYDLG